MGATSVGASALARRLLAGREQSARAGRHQSGTAPLGYMRDYAQGRGGKASVPLRVDPKEAEIVRAIFRLYLELRSIEKVIERLRTAGIRTRRGKEWSRAGIAWILKNETYLGRVHFGTIRARGLHEAIISPLVFSRVRRLMRRNNRRAGRAARRLVIAAAPAARIGRAR